MAESAFLTTYIRTISSQPVTYPDDYLQPASNSLKRVPVLPVPVPPVPPRADKPGESSSDIEVTLKSLKPAHSVTVTIKGTDTVADLKSKWEGEGGELRLLLKGKALQDSKLIREYAMKGGDVVTVMIKPIPALAPVAAPSPSETLPSQAHKTTSSKPQTPTLNISTSTPTRTHNRIPSVVLSPSPSIVDDNGRVTPEPSPKNLLLHLDTEGTLNKDVTSYHATLSKPELWERMLNFLSSEFPHEDDAIEAFEDFLRAAKGVLTASEVAKIRDHVGVMGMAGI